jgi:nitric oxide reductase large subunit
MSDMFLIGALDACGGLLPIVRVVVQLIKIFMIVIPIALIIYGTIDLGKAVIASDEKEVKAAQSRLIKRFIYAALIFFVPMLVGVVMNVVSVGGEGDTASWENCWRAAK